VTCIAYIFNQLVHCIWAAWTVKEVVLFLRSCYGVWSVFLGCLGEPQTFKQLVSSKFALILVCLRLEQMWKSFHVCLPRIKSHLWVLLQLEMTVSHLLWQALPSLPALITMVPYYIVTHLRNQHSGCQTCDTNHIMSWHSRFISHPQWTTQIPCYELQLKWSTANVKVSPGLFSHSFLFWVEAEVDLATRKGQEKIWRLWENRRIGCRWKYGRKYCLNPSCPVWLQDWLRFMLLLLHGFGTSGLLLSWLQP